MTKEIDSKDVLRTPPAQNELVKAAHDYIRAAEGYRLNSELWPQSPIEITVAMIDAHKKLKAALLAQPTPSPTPDLHAITCPMHEWAQRHTGVFDVNLWSNVRCNCSVYPTQKINNMDEPIWLTYQFNGFIFKFKENYVLIYDITAKREYKMLLGHIHYPDIPFTYTLERQD